MTRRKSVQNNVASIKTTRTATDEVNFGDAPSLVLDGDFTIAVTLKGDDVKTAAVSYGICGKRTDSNNREWTLYYVQSTDLLTFIVSTTGGTASTALSVTWDFEDNKWYRLVITRSGNDFALYVNGDIKDTATDATVIGDTSANVTLGAWAKDGGTNWPGNFSRFYINKGYAWDADEAEIDYFDDLQATDGGTVALDARMTTGAGATVTDHSASGNNGTLEGSAAWSQQIPSKRPKSIQNFNNSLDLVKASSQRVLFGAILGFNETNSFSLSTRVKFKGLPVNATPLWDRLSTGGGYRLAINTAGALIFQLRQADNTIQTLTGLVVKGNEWYEIVATFDTSTLKMYFNGALVVSTAFTLADIGTPGSQLALGYSNNNAVYLDGHITRSCIWSKALNASEIADLHYDGVIPTDSLEIHCDYSEGSGTTLGDVSGNGNNGTITAGTAWSATEVPMKPRTDI